MPGPASQTARLPLLVEICLTVTQVLIIVTAGATAILSIIARADVLTIILRTAAAILGVGIPAIFLNWMIGRYFVLATVEDWKNAIPKPEEDDELTDEPGDLETEA